MLHPTHRLRYSADLKRVRQQGRSRSHPLVVLVAQPNDLPESRFAFIASRRVGKAVQRNRARRLLREVVRQHLADVKPGWDCVLIARREAALATYWDVETAVITLLTGLHLLSLPTRSREDASQNERLA
jgi:ribonuclease P protein component